MYPNNQKLHGKNGDLTLLNNLRNSETHFCVHPNLYLSDNEFARLYNFLLDFHELLAVYNLKENSSSHFTSSLKVTEIQKLVHTTKLDVDTFSFKQQLKDSLICKKLHLALNDKSCFYQDKSGHNQYTTDILELCPHEISQELSRIPPEVLNASIKLLYFYDIITQDDELEEVEVEIEGVLQTHTQLVESTIHFNM
ncbi:MAG: hypothetical protein R3Y07_05960 [Eubacteriales bacterium]